mmetsp:Transcript_5932/g.9103  ORF Transcript_5932/g.9103 Transcript_5932/m.9103 type:complete len:227 (-) Transcript_5932:270-950(-)|eukprot:CAMPEP_0184664474 /NCGR_PEP_ID=MMETSP0308-20130426/52963_1 /TAXON_ID=38269 /ORGANISM="Gloeochaete witrockiana, Strain SAG 46.84" /LENGTH=226 /DNA_ID=CAMNT_0027107899 /DNA_START=132 /DNA_END=812 /DNA_ORIENTATION=-
MPPPNRRSKVPVYLNVYDLAKINEYSYWLSLGVFHSGVEILGREWSFGGHEYSFTGVFDVPPKKAPAAVFRESLHMGDLDMQPREIESVLDNMKSEYTGNSYNLVSRNCNHFSDDLVQRLLGKNIPGYINRLANWGLFFNCVLPENWGVVPPSQPQTASGPRPPSALSSSSSGFRLGGVNSIEDTSSQSESSQSSVPNGDVAITGVQKRERMALAALERRDITTRI